MISSKVIEYMRPLFDIISNSKGKTIGEIKDELNIERSKMVKGASGLIVENLLGIENNNRDEADIPEIGCEIKILPLQKNRDGSIKAKEPTAIQMINYMEVAKETWETAKLRGKIALTFWVVYLVKKNGKSLNQNDYVIVDYFWTILQMYKMVYSKRIGKRYKATSKKVVLTNYLAAWVFILNLKQKAQITKIRRMLLMVKEA